MADVSTISSHDILFMAKQQQQQHHIKFLTCRTTTTLLYDDELPEDIESHRKKERKDRQNKLKKEILLAL